MREENFKEEEAFQIDFNVGVLAVVAADAVVGVAVVGVIAVALNVVIDILKCCFYRCNRC